MVLSVEYASENTWTEVCKHVKNAVVFIDDCSVECLHWHGGLNRLLTAGALSVKEFSSFEGGEKNEKKAVFLVKNPLVGPPRTILKDIISNSFFEHCVVITPCSPSVLYLATTGSILDHSNYNKAAMTLNTLENDILQWMKNKEYTVEILTFSYGVVPLSEYLFITPAFSDLFPLFEEDLGIKKMKAFEWEMESLPLEMQVSIAYLITTLNSLLSQLNLREDIYCLGPLSALIGSQLQELSSNSLRSKTAKPRVSLLLIDRTLDMSSTVSYENDCFLDCMKRVLPSFPNHTIDVAVDMSCLCATTEENNFDLLLPGCLHEPRIPMFEWLFQYSPADILKGLSKELCKILSIEEKCFLPLELEKIIKENFAQNNGLIKKHSGFLQFTLGVIQSLKSNAINKIKLARSFQVLLLQSLASDNNTDHAVQQILDLINKRHNRGFDLEHIFSILIFFYSFIGNQYKVNPDLEALLMTALGKAFIEDRGKYCDNEKLNFNDITDVDEFCSHILKKLHSLKNSRQHLLKYRKVAIYEDSMMPLEHKSVINQLFEDIVNPNKPDIPDLKHKPNLSLSDNFASRISMILNSTRPHITDSESLLVFVIGGITGQEVKSLRNFLKFYEKPFIIGSTALLSSTDVVKKLFLNNPLNPLLI